MKTLLRLFVIGCLWLIVACSAVEPWERERLARPEMAFDPDPMEAKMSGHIYFSKEGSSSGASVSGGGCGCN